MATKKNTATTSKTTTTSKTAAFDPKKATLTEFNRELKRLASRKCRAKSDDEKAQFAAEYEQLAALKAKRFPSSRASFITMTPEQIAQLSLDETIRGIKSLQSTRCVYPHRRDEVLAVESLFQARRAELQERAAFEALKAKYGDQ